MTLLDDLARLVQHGERALGACSLAHHAGATHLCIFIRDPELAKFLPAPGFPQRLPNGIEWADYLRLVANSSSSSAQRQMRSPFSSSCVTAVGVLLSEDAIVVFLGDEIHADACERLAPSFSIIAALLIQEVRTSILETHADLSHRTIMESRQLAAALSTAHDTLAEALDARESLLKKIRKQDGRLQLVRRIAGIWVTKQIIEKHGGSIRIRSNCTTECHGTTFLVCLPRLGEGNFFRDSEMHLRYRSLEVMNQNKDL